MERVDLRSAWGQIVAITENDGQPVQPPMSETPPSPGGWELDAPLSRRQRKWLNRVSEAVGEPVTAAAAFRVEGTLPWYAVGLALGVGTLGGALGAVLGAAVGYSIARLVTLRRGRGVGFVTIVAATATEVFAVKANFWTNRPKATRVGEWPLGQITARHKRITVALTLDLPDGHQVRLESPVLFRTNGRAMTLANHLGWTAK
jgi:hypothetical protein